jgi:hypothetical protein
MGVKLEQLTENSTPKQKATIIAKACAEIELLDKTITVLADSQKWLNLDEFNKDGREMAIAHICKRRNVDVEYIKTVMAMRPPTPDPADAETDAMKEALSSNRISRQSEKRMAYAKAKKEREAPTWK